MAESGKSDGKRSKIQIIFDWIKVAFHEYPLLLTPKDSSLKERSSSSQEYVRLWLGHLDPAGIDQWKKWKEYSDRIKAVHPKDPSP